MLIFICLYIVGHYVIQYIYLFATISLSVFVSVAITVQGGIGIRLVAGRVPAIIAALLGIFSLDILDILYFAA